MTVELEDYYAARASEYDRIYAKPERQDDLRAVERWLAQAFAGKSVIEIACGTGYWTQFIAPDSGSVLALDASHEVLAIARSRVTAPHVSFVIGDAYRPPEGTAPFESAFAGFWLSHVPKARLGEFLEGLHRTLAPGAKVVLLDNLYVEGSSTPISEEDAQGNTYQARKLDDGSVHRVLKNFPSEHDLREMVAGIATDVVYRRWRYFWALEYACSREAPFTDSPAASPTTAAR
ncbi:class I SAM-dependent methyltransferase [Ramlibacter sp.]|uniref:class I SAM-dependent methyltransferase n=1 Tax=Ramlibacter sp. TaxID=1917967 RepID=UPI003D0AD53F